MPTGLFRQAVQSLDAMLDGGTATSRSGTSELAGVAAESTMDDVEESDASGAEQGYENW
jgi:hypothetical protein